MWTDVRTFLSIENHEIARFIPQIPQFAYATKDDCVYVNLFMESEAKLKLQSGEVRISQKTEYPWNGGVKITIDDLTQLSALNFKLNIRVPGWCIGRPRQRDADLVSGEMTVL